MFGRCAPVNRARATPNAHLQTLRPKRSVMAISPRPAVRRRLEELFEETRADEIIATAQIYDDAARLRSFEIAAEAFGKLNS